MITYNLYLTRDGRVAGTVFGGIAPGFHRVTFASLEHAAWEIGAPRSGCTVLVDGRPASWSSRGICPNARDRRAA